jgi:hypothetical protein
MSMKRMHILLCGLVVLGITAGLARADNSLESQLSTRLGKAISLSAGEVKANQIVKGDVAYSGIAVAAIKTDNLLELFNPLAPAAYGSALDNTLEDLNTGKARAWKLFSIQF